MESIDLYNKEFGVPAAVNNNPALWTTKDIEIVKAKQNKTQQYIDQWMQNTNIFSSFSFSPFYASCTFQYFLKCCGCVFFAY